jgi:endonuclease/exonuclease/phosphatase (EEP) superfamily protein YafD
LRKGASAARRARRRRPAGIFGLPTAAAFAFAILSVLGGEWPVLDLYGQLQAQAAVGVAAVGLVALATWRWARFFCALAAGAVLAWLLQPQLALPPRLAPQAGAGAPVRIAWANLQNWSTKGPAVSRLLEAETPDIAVLTELSENHRAAVSAAAAYPFRTAFPAGSAYDILLMSRIRPEFVRFDYTVGLDIPVMEARFCATEAATACLTIVALHAPGPPLPWAAVGVPATTRDGLLALAASMVRRHLAARDHVLLLGDFNATPSSRAFRDVVAASGLADTTAAPSEMPVRPRPTWFSSWPGIGLAIDHALVSPGIRIAERRLGPDIGSDHWPLVLHVRLADQP